MAWPIHSVCFRKNRALAVLHRTWTKCDSGTRTHGYFGIANGLVLMRDLVRTVLIAHPLSRTNGRTLPTMLLFSRKSISRRRSQWIWSARGGIPNLVAQVGCGPGLITHQLASNGLSCVGLARDGASLALAQQCTAGQSYPGVSPQFKSIPDDSTGGARKLPLNDGEVDFLLLFEQLEYHANPVALLREAKRVLSPGSKLLVICRRPPANYPPPPGPQGDLLHPCRPDTPRHAGTGHAPYDRTLPMPNSHVAFRSSCGSRAGQTCRHGKEESTP